MQLTGGEVPVEGQFWGIVLRQDFAHCAGQRDPDEAAFVEAGPRRVWRLHEVEEVRVL